MSRILALAWKDACVRFSSRSELLFFLILPLVFTVILGSGAIGGGQDDAPGIPMLAVDEDGSESSAELLTILGESRAVAFELMPRGDAERAFEDETPAGLLVVPSGFGERLASGQPAEVELRLIPNDLDSLAVEQAVRSAAATVGRALGVAYGSLAEAERVRPFADEAERQSFFEASLRQAQSLVAAAPTRMVTTEAIALESEGSEIDTAAQASAGQLITWVFIPLLATSGLFAYERVRGTMSRLITTPTTSATYLLGTIVGQLALAIVQMGLLVGFAALVMKVTWGNSALALAVLLLCFALAGVAFGTMLGTFIKTEEQAGGLSIMLGMAMALLGGCWYPIELFPEVARSAARILPTNWAMQGLLDLTTRGQGLAGILPEAGVLLGFAVVFFVVGVWRFRFE
jgi:ABC-2 type transport system permease protein